MALGAFAAATMAGSSPFRTGLEAMRLGGVIYVAPFFFVLNPALVGEAPLPEVIIATSTALIGVWFISAALQGHVSFIGGFAAGVKGIGLRAVLLLSGLFFAVPENDYIGLNHWQLAAIGLGLAAAPLLAAWTWHREDRTAAQPTERPVTGP